MSICIFANLKKIFVNSNIYIDNSNIRCYYIFAITNIVFEYSNNYEVIIITTKERVQEIRKTLKSNGYSNRQISVTYDGAIWVTIKDSNIKLEDIENLVKKYENYRTDEITGEILSGGNTFVFVQYDYILTV